MNTKRFQLDLTEAEHSVLEQLVRQSGVKTKRELVSNALTLFRWAATELLHGRSVGSIDANGAMVKQLEMPGLAAFSAAAARLDRQRPAPDELAARITREGVPAEEVLRAMKQKLAEVPHGHGQGVSRSRGEAPPTLGDHLAGSGEVHG